MVKKRKKTPDSIDLNEMRLKQRRGWEINPKTRVVPSKKIYKRGQAKLNFKKELQDT